MKPRLCPVLSAKTKGLPFAMCPGGEARVERAGKGTCACGHHLPSAELRSIGVLPPSRPNTAERANRLCAARAEALRD